jgi:arsenate reductase (thioredoxin)
MGRQRILFLFTHNSARSQMAEGFLRAVAGDRFEVASAGTEATRVHPLAIRAMAEVGIDISHQASKAVDTLADQPWDAVVTVCDDANERSPSSQAARRASTGTSTIRRPPTGRRPSASESFAGSATRLRIGSGGGWPANLRKARAAAGLRSGGTAAGRRVILSRQGQESVPYQGSLPLPGVIGVEERANVPSIGSRGARVSAILGGHPGGS